MSVAKSQMFFSPKHGKDLGELSGKYSDMVYITEDSYVNITKSPKELIVL